MLIHMAHLPYPLAVLISISLTTLAGALMYRFVIIRIKGQTLSEVIAPSASVWPCWSCSGISVLSV